MKRSNLILLTVLMLAWATLPLIAASNSLVKQIIKLQPQADKDGDGKLSKAEEAALIKMILRRFPRADANGDGALSDAEKLRLLERGEARMKQRTDAGRSSASSPMTNNSTASGNHESGG